MDSSIIYERGALLIGVCVLCSWGLLQDVFKDPALISLQRIHRLRYLSGLAMYRNSVLVVVFFGVI